MQRAIDLVRKSESIIRYIDEQVTINKPESPKDVLPVIYGLQQVFPQWVSMICPAHHPEWYYVSENCEQLFGYDANYVTSFLPPQKFFQQIHESDLEDLYQCFNFVDRFMKEADPGDHHKFRLAFRYRFRRKDGQYVFMHDEKAVFQSSDGFRLYYALFRDLTHELPFTGVQLEIYKLEDGLIKCAEFKPGLEKKLSTRESQLINLIKKGLTTKEIAHHLSISHNTVRNIRSRMFEKYRVNNVIELLNMAG